MSDTPMSAAPISAAAPDAGDVSGPEPALPLAALPLAQPLNALAIDTTSDVLGLALLRQGVLVAARHEALGRRTTQEILPRIAALLEGAALSPAALDVLVVARGPGSFTGTRIGMAVALTFAQVTGRPLVGVEALRVLAAGADPTPGAAFTVLLNCARDEVYHARYRWHRDGLARASGIALSTVTVLAPTLSGAPVLLRRFNPGVGTTPEAEAAFAALRPLPAHVLAAGLPVAGAPGVQGATTLDAELDAVRLLRCGLGRYLAAPGQDWRRGAGGCAPIYLKSEAFRTWRPGP